MLATSEYLILVDKNNIFYTVDSSIRKHRKIDKNITGIYWEEGLVITSDHEIHSYDI